MALFDDVRVVETAADAAAADVVVRAASARVQQQPPSVCLADALVLVFGVLRMSASAAADTDGIWLAAKRVDESVQIEPGL